MLNHKKKHQLQIYVDPLKETPVALSTANVAPNPKATTNTIPAAIYNIIIVESPLEPLAGLPRAAVNLWTRSNATWRSPLAMSIIRLRVASSDVNLLSASAMRERASYPSNVGGLPFVLGGWMNEG